MNNLLRHKRRVVYAQSVLGPYALLRGWVAYSRPADTAGCLGTWARHFRTIRTLSSMLLVADSAYFTAQYSPNQENT